MNGLKGAISTSVLLAVLVAAASFAMLSSDADDVGKQVLIDMGDGAVNGALLGMNYRYEKGAVQTLDNLRKMYDLATLIPAVLFGVMALLLFVYYPLSRRKVAELQELKELKLKEAYEKNEIDI